MTEKPRTPALQEAAKRRRTLHEALVGLEFAISSPAAGRIPDWTSLVTKEVTAIRDAWDQHVDTTEKPGGLYEEIVGISPRLARMLQRSEYTKDAAAPKNGGNEVSVASGSSSPSRPVKRSRFAAAALAGRRHPSRCRPPSPRLRAALRPG